MALLRGPRLSQGDPIRVVAPSGPVPRDDFEAGIAHLTRRYRPRYDPAALFAADGYLAGSDEHRLAELNAAIRDPAARAVLMARGGYGLMRLLPFIDAAALRADPKPLVGFSDGTALLAFAAHAGVAAIHGPVITQMGRLPAGDHEALFRLLERPDAQVLLTDLDAAVPGRVQGPLIGGNLEVFSRLIGTPFLPDPTGAILFIEDLGERPYRVDRLITHLDLAGIFNVLSAVVVGDFSGCKEPAGSKVASPPVEGVLQERLGRLAIPVAFGAPVGHGERNVALPYGTLAELDTRHGTLVALEGVVR